MGKYFCSRSLSGDITDMHICIEGFQCTFTLGQSSCQVVTGKADGHFKREIYLGGLNVRYIIFTYKNYNIYNYNMELLKYISIQMIILNVYLYIKYIVYKI